MTTTATYGTLSASEHSTQLRKAVIASTIGPAIEWHDFFLYGAAAGLIFGKLFFPNSDPLTATLAAFGTYFIGFVGRPIGAAIFGHYGDRIGRKATLIATLFYMGIATFLIAFVPTYETVGIWGAVILTVLRMIQSIGVGGEWGGSVLLAMEWSRHRGHRGHRRLVASWPQFGVPCGLFLANLAVLAFSQLSGDYSPSGAGAFPSRCRSFWSEANHPVGFAAVVGAGAVLHLHCVYLRLCSRHVCICRATCFWARCGQPPSSRSSPSRCRAISPTASAARNRGSDHGRVRLPLFRDGRHRGSRDGVRRDSAVACSAWTCSMDRRRR